MLKLSYKKTTFRITIAVIVVDKNRLVDVTNLCLRKDSIILMIYYLICLLNQMRIPIPIVRRMNANSLI